MVFVQGGATLPTPGTDSPFYGRANVQGKARFAEGDSDYLVVGNRQELGQYLILSHEKSSWGKSRKIMTNSSEVLPAISVPTLNPEEPKSL